MRRRLLPLAAGTAAGFLALAGPFLAADPVAFVHDVVVAQFARTARAATPFDQRFAYLFGVRQAFAGPPPPSSIGLEVAIALAVVLALGLGLPLLARRGSPLEAYALAATAVTTGIMFIPEVFYSHYAYLPDACLAVALALAADRGRRLVLKALGRSERARHVALAVGSVLGIAVLAGAGLLASSEAAYARSVLAGVGDPGKAIAAVLPAGSCALSDAASVLIAADRYSTAGSCPALVDPSGLSIATDPGRPALLPGRGADRPGDPQLDRWWEQNLGSARYLVSLRPLSIRIPWDPALEAWFAAHYKLVAVSGAFIFENRRFAAAPPG